LEAHQHHPKNQKRSENWLRNVAPGYGFSLSNNTAQNLMPSGGAPCTEVTKPRSTSAWFWPRKVVKRDIAALHCFFVQRAFLSSHGAQADSASFDKADEAAESEHHAVTAIFLPRRLTTVIFMGVAVFE
jgi:hypothetical protein